MANDEVTVINNDNSNKPSVKTFDIKKIKEISKKRREKHQHKNIETKGKRSSEEKKDHIKEAKINNSEGKSEEKHTKVDEMADANYNITCRDVIIAAYDGMLSFADFLKKYYKDKFIASDNSSGLNVYKYSKGFWTPDKSKTYFNGDRFARELIRKASDYNFVANIHENLRESNKKVLNSALKWVTNLSSFKHIVERAFTGGDGLMVSSSDFDRDIGELSTPEGKLNLETGVVTALTPEDLRTRSTAVSYCDPQLLKPEKETSWWMALREMFKWYRYPGEFKENPQWTPEEKAKAIGDYAMNMQAWKNNVYADEAVCFLQRLIGYCLLGTNREQKFILFVGENGRNGKGVILHMLASVLGDYVTDCRTETFMKTRGRTASGSATPDLMKLKGVRIAIINENEHGDAINSSFVKKFTGGDKVSGRALYSDEETFQPSAVPILATNHFPHFDSEDNALFARMITVHFPRTFKEDIADEDITPFTGRRDNDLEKKLNAEKNEIFAWAVHGAMEYCKRGSLDVPEYFKAYASEYRNRRDTLQTFIDEYCNAGADYSIPKVHLFEAFSKFLSDSNMKPWTLTIFSERLKSKGYVEYKSGTNKIKGLELTTYHDCKNEREDDKPGQALRETKLQKDGYRGDGYLNYLPPDRSVVRY